MTQLMKLYTLLTAGPKPLHIGLTLLLAALIGRSSGNWSYCYSGLVMAFFGLGTLHVLAIWLVHSRKQPGGTFAEGQLKFTGWLLLGCLLVFLFFGKTGLLKLFSGNCDWWQFGAQLCKAATVLVFGAPFWTGRVYLLSEAVPPAIYPVWIPPAGRPTAWADRQGQGKLRLQLTTSNGKPVRLRYPFATGFSVGDGYRFFIGEVERKYPGLGLDAYFKMNENGGAGLQMFMRPFFFWKKHLDPALSLQANRAWPGWVLHVKIVSVQTVEKN